MKWKVYRYVNGRNPTGRPWKTGVQADSAMEAIRAAAFTAGRDVKPGFLEPATKAWIPSKSIASDVRDGKVRYGAFQEGP